MKQTAVEWLVEELNKSIGLTKFVDTCDEDYKKEILGIIKQAKAMEEEQIESLLEKAIQERDYYYNLWKKANAYIVKK